MTKIAGQTDFGKTIVCVDSYVDGIPKGCLYTPYMEAESFESLSQLLILIENLLNESRRPQAYTVARKFSDPLEPIRPPPTSIHLRKGLEMTFEIRVFYRQYTSWQGVVTWLDRKLEQNFRSALELILLMDSALRAQKGCDSA